MNVVKDNLACRQCLSEKKVIVSHYIMDFSFVGPAGHDDIETYH